MSEQSTHYVTAPEIAQLAQNYYPPEVRAETRRRARAGAKNELDLVLIWRDLKSEIPHGAVGIVEREYAADMMIKASTLRRKIAAVRNYEAWQLEELMNLGISWEHLHAAGDLAEIAHKTPLQILEEAHTLGNAHGEVMTVEEMTVHALGETYRPQTFAAFGWLSRLAELPLKLKWDADKATRYTNWIEQGKEFLK